ncbi:MULTISPECIES: oxidoreductase [Micromonospora]|uniref:oxidoreductase n=1 Tax=Micromonospora TaxID=1873 RepID=UPI001B368336|nr:MULTISPECIES: oxidoreductase [unclassified Micromonospora]MBQ0978324.1 oxidoreductase [Micromonospora sp. M61]MBQ1038147.1 oxidoreductase [Micromonospora sp. C81]WTI18677.1 oxidoreductase [Micromonospora zamorensis]
MADTLKHVEEMLDDSPTVDVHETFHRYQALLNELKDKITARFTLTRDPSTEALENYGDYPNGPGGSLAAYTGPEVDWLVHSWLGNPGASFANLHLTCWLGPQVRVPHLGLALLVWPGGWFYVDSVPRVNMVEDGDYYDRYYEPANEEWLQLRNDPAFDYFISRAGFIRASLSPTAYCYSFDRSPENIEKVSQVTHAHVDRWLRWVDEAEPVPAEERAALAETDLRIRRNIADRDPANVMGVRYFGEETTNQLVRALWGGDRELPRPSA